MAKRKKKTAKKILTPEEQGLVYDKAWPGSWVTPEELNKRLAIREERMFMRRARQGELQCPMIISDSQGGIHGVQSMADGKHYDSKSNMRRHYREAGVIEIGNDPAYTSDVKNQVVPHKRAKSRAQKDAKFKRERDTVEKAVSTFNLTQYRENEI